MIRSLACSLLFLFMLPGSSSAQPTAPNSGPIQGTLGQPLQVGPWQVLVQRAYASQWEETPTLDVLVSLRNISATPEQLPDTMLFNCYRSDVWQGLPYLGSDPPPPSVVDSNLTIKGTLRYQLPPDVLSFGLVFFWQAPGGGATGIWSLQLHT